MQVLPLVFALLVATPAIAAETVWSGFRGTGNSHSSEADLPLVWRDGQNIAWSCPLEGKGQSSPVVWNDRVFITSVKGENKESLIVTCVTVGDGRIAWQKEFPASVTQKATDYVSQAAPTPVVDAERVYCFFESGDILALTHAGETAWARSLTKEFGPIKGNHGLGSSPAQTDEAVIVLVDHDGPSYLLSLEKRSGKTLWKSDRDSRVSWSSPVVSAGANGPEVIISSNGTVQSYDVRDGKRLWEVNGISGNTVASPSVTEDAVVVGSSQPGGNLLIRRGGQGDVTETKVAWRAETATSSFGSPLVVDGRAYFVNKAGVAFGVDLAKGTTLWSQRLPDSTWASPVAAGGRVYIFCKNGTTIVIRPGDTFEQLAENQLAVDDRLYGVAVAHKGFVLRSGSKLIFVRDAATKAQ